VADDHYGNEHILKVLLPGELLGFDGFHNGKYQCSAFALEALSFCILPAQSMNDLFQNHPALTRELFRHSSEKINQDKDFIVLSKQPAEEKMAHFLINLSDRMKKRGFSSSEFTLLLTRQEIGNHLGLAMETVSRLLKKFQQQELILVKSKFIVLKNIPKLRAVITHSK
jgi:CRP/FNR family transcriptional regulator